MVRRQLIINHGIEQMLLIENVEEASAILFDQERPRNVKRCYCIDRRDRRRGVHLSYTRTGDPNHSPLSAYTGRPRMKTDLESQIRLQRDTVSNLKLSLQEIEQQQRQARDNYEKCKQTLVRNQRQDRDIQLQIQKAEDSVDELREAIEKDSMEDGRLDVFKHNLEEVKEEKRVYEGSYEESVVAMDSLLQEIEVIQSELSAKNENVEAIQKKVQRLEGQETKCSTSRRKALGEKNALEGRLEEAKRDKTETENRRQEIASRILDFHEKANMVSPRVQVDEGETTNSLGKKLEKLMKDMQRFNAEYVLLCNSTHALCVSNGH